MMLLVDIGNTQVKWVLADAKSWRVERFILNPVGFDTQLDAAWRALPTPGKIYASSVVGSDYIDRLSDWCQRHWDRSPHIVSTQSAQLGVVNDYDKPETLGVDRWLNLLAARNRVAGNVCVISCGTAVTVDALTAEGRFLGGVILPGLTTMRRALSQQTVAIDEQPGNPDALPARNTADGVYTGTRLALEGAIRHIVDMYRQLLGSDMVILLTGGDAELLRTELGDEVVVEPDLVLKGLALVAGEKC